MKNSVIVVRPIISERSLSDAQKGVFTFEVVKNATKGKAASEISRLFNVKVTGITSQIVKGKTRFAGRKRIKVRQPDIKKVRVTLTKGQTITLFEVGQTA
ncbi:MAG: 50S ribosomal protein L23, large subunit ribosomal protein L23 [Candidatus Gottesmanbacteria bacterium GW2011_GWA2_43_14]|uniref:Large ribosomal subunit protein uL23 n=1 Tax=Candidatus Gottesmanbacteria bacterium GW2011_GWA2_43_14 TaxID=1618443 RepID=A0A0G1GAM8_9BACT|nr:MAG: 50S ribosomal protein L23, large subunit ribosomal protein L23 [Candidatus Gottesmanbacteria bacterium GW2011_GWA2_43_14]